MTEPRMEASKPPYLAAVAVSAAVFVIYILTLAPTTWFWDTSEYIATAHILGIPHPPGNPLFVVVGRVWSVLLGIGDVIPVAVRINLLAAVTSAVAAGFFFLVAHRILAHFIENRWARIAGAAASVLIGATAYTVWNQANVNEKVYTLAVLTIAVVSWLAFLWRERRDDPASVRYLVLAIFLMVLGATNHLMALLPAPALGLMILVTKPGVLLDRALLTRGLIAVLIGFSFNFFLPIRSAQQPIINEGDPRCEEVVETVISVFSWGYLGEEQGGCEALSANLTREQYAKPPLTERQAPLGHQLHNYFQYFDWQWARSVAEGDGTPGNARLPFTLLFLGLGLAGLVAMARHDREAFTFHAALAFTLSFALVYYLNFRHGWSLAPDMETEVRERDYFFIASFVHWGVLAGIGLSWGWAALAQRVQEREERGDGPSAEEGGRASSTKGGGGQSARQDAAGGADPDAHEGGGDGPDGPARGRRTPASLSGGGRAWLVTGPILLVALIPLVFNWAWADRSDDHSARDWAYNMLQSVEPYGVIFTNGDNDTFPLWYLQEVEEIRQDVTVAVYQYLFTSWYPSQLQYHTQPERQRHFREEQATGIHPIPEAPPERPVTEVPDETLRTMAGAPLDSDFTLELEEGPVTIPAGTPLNRGDMVLATLIRDAADERPIYFASTFGAAEGLGLSDQLVREGMAYRLTGGDPDEMEGVYRVSPELRGDAVHAERTKALAEEVFSYRGLMDRDVWQDRPTSNIPFHFYLLYLHLADIGTEAGFDQGQIQGFRERIDAFGVTAEGGHRVADPPGAP